MGGVMGWWRRRSRPGVNKMIRAASGEGGEPQGTVQRRHAYLQEQADRREAGGDGGHLRCGRVRRHDAAQKLG